MGWGAAVLNEKTAARAPAAAAQSPLRGIALIVASTLFFACSDVIAKALTATLPPVEVAWLRYVTFVLILGAAVPFSGGAAAVRSYNPSLQLLRGLGTVGSALLFTAGLTMLPVAEATSIYFISPILITALSIPLLGIIPESEEVLRASNVGSPVTLNNEASAPARAYMDAARRLMGETIPMSVPAEKKGLFGMFFGRRAA